MIEGDSGGAGPADGVVNPHDVQARYSVKRGAGWVGDKVHVSEICEPDTPHVITNVATTDATLQDTEMTDQVHQALHGRELLPAEHLVDYGTPRHLCWSRPGTNAT
ncbi:hypothetical protein [Streptomyces sp. NPDC058683]|uniref:hypothetical protein n=1 Tax=Streptomyces sp. NPDC058683 TaxID=3346597 RepID=UPI00365E1305